MKGEQLDQAEFTAHGLVGDRAYALIDKVTGKVATGQNPKLFPNLLDCQVAFVEPPRAGHEPPSVRITLPDGTTVMSDSSDIDRVLSTYFGRDLTLAGRRRMTSPSTSTIPTLRDCTGRLPKYNG